MKRALFALLCGALLAACGSSGSSTPDARPGSPDAAVGMPDAPPAPDSPPGMPDAATGPDATAILTFYDFVEDVVRNHTEADPPVPIDFGLPDDGRGFSDLLP
jgi:hypothetical protein